MLDANQFAEKSGRPGEDDDDDDDDDDVSLPDETHDSLDLACVFLTSCVVNLSRMTTRTTT